MDMTKKARLLRFEQLQRGPIYDAKWDGRSTFSVEEAGCEILGLSKCSAYAAANSGVLPTIRVGRRRSSRGTRWNEC